MSSSLSVAGKRTSGSDVRQQNVMAALAMANIVKSSLGPVGLDKMLVDEVGDVTITNDGATILKQLEVEHPAAKVLVELSNLQDQEVGDGTTSVVILASELLKQANELVKRKVHPTSVIAGLNLAKKEACKFIAKNMAKRVDSLGPDTILNAARTSMSSKIIGNEGEFFAKLAVDAVQAVQTTTASGKIRYPVKAISILKAHGKSMRESFLVDGFALNSTRAAQGMPTYIEEAKIAMLDVDFRKVKMPMGVQVLVTDPDKLEAIRAAEGKLTRDRIQLLIDAGANVVLTTQGIDDQAMKVFVENGVIAARRVKRRDLLALAKVTGGEFITTLADYEGDEGEPFPVSALGTCQVVEENRIGDGELLYFKGTGSTRAQTIILRGANDFMLDEIERSLHDSMSIVKRTLESKTVVAGGGCVEAALSVYMNHFADTLGSREQLAVSVFAESMLIIPNTLAVNGAFDATDLVAKLRAFHNMAQTQDGKEEYGGYGLDLDDGKVRNNLQAGVLEPAMSKIKMIRFATEAAVTILRIDDAIKMNPANNPNAPVQNRY